MAEGDVQQTGQNERVSMKLVFVNIMQELQRFDSMSYLTQPPVPLAILNAATPKIIEEIDHVAKAEGLSASAIIRRAVLRDLPRLIRPCKGRLAMQALTVHLVLRTAPHSERDEAAEEERGHAST